MPTPRIYPWEEWFARSRFVLRGGHDYRCSRLSMAQQVRNAAVKYGKVIRVAETEDGLAVEVLGDRIEAPACPS